MAFGHVRSCPSSDDSHQIDNDDDADNTSKGAAIHLSNQLAVTLAPRLITYVAPSICPLLNAFAQRQRDMPGVRTRAARPAGVNDEPAFAASSPAR